jgi:hypothetical protein
LVSRNLNPFIPSHDEVLQVVLKTQQCKKENSKEINQKYRR